MKKKLIAAALVLIILLALPLSVNAVQDIYDGYIFKAKEVTCPSCGCTFVIRVAVTYHVVHGVCSSYGIMNATAPCPSCGTMVTWHGVIPRGDIPQIK